MWILALMIASVRIERDGDGPHIDHYPLLRIPASARTGAESCDADGAKRQQEQASVFHGSLRQGPQNADVGTPPNRGPKADAGGSDPLTTK